MNRADIIANISARYGVTLPQSDPVLLVADVLDQILQKHSQLTTEKHKEFIQEIKDLLNNSKDSLPYLLEIRRQEMDNIANKLQNAGELLHIEQRKKSEMIYDQISVQLEQRATEFSNQALKRLEISFKNQIEDQLIEPTKQLSQLANTLGGQQNEYVKSKQFDFAWMGLIGLSCGLVGGLIVLYLS
jgi:hypothetical protein